MIVIAKRGVATIGMVAALSVVAACGGGNKGSSVEDIPVMTGKTFIYNPNERHKPVSLSGSDLVGLEPRVR